MTAPIDRINASPLMRTLGQRLIALGDGTAMVECAPAQPFENAMARMHGGFIAALIDTVLGAAVHTKVAEDTKFGTIDLNVKFVRAITIETGTLTATAKVVHAGRTMLTAEARIADAAGKLYAHGSGSFLVYPKQ
jgi:acyl-CoA thioesterase